jgi:hypothetical protein
MNKRYIDQLTKTDHTEEEQDAILCNIVRAHLDTENRTKWATQLLQQGIVRQPAKKRRSWKIFALAAAVLVLIASVGIWQWQKPQTPEALALQFIQEDEPIQLPAGFRGDAAANAQRAAAIEAYHAKNYTAAIQLLNSAGQQDLFLLAMCYFYTRDYQRAIPMLIQVNATGGTYRTQATWFLALAHLRSGNTAAAIPYLQQLSEDQGAGYAEKATQLLQSIAH